MNKRAEARLLAHRAPAAPAKQQSQSDINIEFSFQCLCLPEFLFLKIRLNDFGWPNGLAVKIEDVVW